MAATKEIMESVISDLAKVGIEVTSDTPEWSALLSKYDNMDFQIGRLGWARDHPDHGQLPVPAVPL